MQTRVYRYWILLEIIFSWSFFDSLAPDPYLHPVVAFRLYFQDLPAPGRLFPERRQVMGWFVPWDEVGLLTGIAPICLLMISSRD